MTEYRECPFCGKAIRLVLAGHIVPDCKCFNDLQFGGKSMPVLIPAEVWQSRPYVDALKAFIRKEREESRDPTTKAKVAAIFGEAVK